MNIQCISTEIFIVCTFRAVLLCAFSVFYLDKYLMYIQCIFTEAVLYVPTVSTN